MKALNHFGTLQALTEERNELNEKVAVWIDVLKDIACSVEPLAGGKLAAAQQIKAKVTHEVEIRFRPGITADLRFVFRGRVFDIEYVTNPKERDERLLLMCSEGVVNA